MHEHRWLLIACLRSNLSQIGESFSILYFFGILYNHNFSGYTKTGIKQLVRKVEWLTAHTVSFNSVFQLSSQHASRVLWGQRIKVLQTSLCCFRPFIDHNHCVAATFPTSKQNYLSGQEHGEDIFTDICQKNKAEPFVLIKLDQSSNNLLSPVCFKKARTRRDA